MIRALEIPETHPKRIQWLESELVGTAFPRLVTQLAAIHGTDETEEAESRSEPLLSDRRLLEQGLKWIDATQLEGLLRNPSLLQRVQQAVLTEGAEYWSQVQPPADQLSADRCAAGLSLAPNGVRNATQQVEAGSNHQAGLDAHAEPLATTQDIHDTVSKVIDTNATTTTQTPVVVRSTRWYPSAAWGVVASAATAAVLLLTVNQWHPQGSSVATNRGDVLGDSPSTEPRDSDPTPRSNAIARDPKDGTSGSAPQTVELAANDAETSGKMTNDAENVASRGEPAVAIGWGFERFVSQVATDEATLAPPLDRNAYLMQLAEAADAWASKRPESTIELVKRLGQFRMGCSAILIAEHGPLADSDRRWLRDRCRSWASALDRHLAAAESTDDPIAVRGQVDATVAKIAEAIRGRAETTPS